MERVDRFDGFRRKFILSKEAAGSLEELSAAAARYDAIVVGSDQLWRPDNIFPEYYTLSWVPDRIPKFAYATSFGVSRLDRYSKERAKSFLGRFTAISVRENSGHAIVEALTGKSVPIVCDPVFLLTKKEWEKISDASRCPKEQYIFTYFLGAGKECRRFAGKLSDRTGLPVVGIVQNDAYRASDEQIDCPIDGASPEEFLGLLSNAAYICTDSFHAAAFSTIFNKRFFVFNRFASKKHGTNSRIQSLLEMLGLEGRLMAGADEAATADINDMDYTEANEKLFAFVHRSEGFIESQILKGEAWGVTEKSFASQYDQEHRRNRVLSKKFI